MGMKKRIIYSSLRFTLLFVGCSQKLSPKEYFSWVQSYKNGLHKKRIAGDFKFDVQYKPLAFLAIQQLGVDLSEQEYKELQMKADGMYYFTLKLGTTSKGTDLIRYGSLQEQQQRIYYFSYTFQNDIYIEKNGTRKNCVLYHFERSYDLKGERSFVLCFKKESTEKKGEIKLVIDSPLLKVGIVKIKINPLNVPSLSL